MLSIDAAELVGVVFLPWFPPAVFLVNLLALGYRLVAIVDAYRVTEYVNAYGATGGGRLGRPRVALNPVSAAGLLAVILVMAGAHVAVARYDLLLAETSECVFNPEAECVDDGGSPSPTPGGSDEPNRRASRPVCGS